MKTYLIFIIQAYEIEAPPEHLNDVTTIEVIAETADEALLKAKKLIVKKEYRISSIIEKELCESQKT